MKINDLRRRGIALFTAVALGLSGGTLVKNMSARAEGIGSSVPAITLVSEKHETLTYEQFMAIVDNAYNYLSQFINYEGMREDIKCRVYLVNVQYIDRELEQRLIAEGVIYSTNVNDEFFWVNFDNGENLKNNVCEYNQSTIHHQQLNGNFDISKLIDLSCLYAEQDDRAAYYQLFVNWFNSYVNGKFGNNYFTEGFKQLTALNSFENGRNIYDNSVGSRYDMWMGVGEDFMQMMRDYGAEKWSQEELSRYFDKGMLLKSQWVLRTDVTIDRTCIQEGSLEEFVLIYGQLDYVVHDIVYNDIYNYMGARCESNTK